MGERWESFPGRGTACAKARRVKHLSPITSGLGENIKLQSLFEINFPLLWSFVSEIWVRVLFGTHSFAGRIGNGKPEENLI